MLVDGKNMRPIWLNDNPEIVNVIDQRMLPHRLVIADLRKVDDAIKAIREMYVRGAPLIGATGAWAVYLAAANAAGGRVTEEYLDSECSRIASARSGTDRCTHPPSPASASRMIRAGSSVLGLSEVKMTTSLLRAAASAIRCGALRGASLPVWRMTVTFAGTPNWRRVASRTSALGRNRSVSTASGRHSMSLGSRRCSF